jgi:hypothetical protein
MTSIFLRLPQEILEMIFIKLPINFMENLYYDKINKTYWMNFPVRLSNRFWINKTYYDYLITETEYNNSSKRGYYRYAEILSRNNLCKDSINLIDIRVFLYRAVKYDNINLFIKGLKYLDNSKNISEKLGQNIDIFGTQVITYCITNNLVTIDECAEYLLNPNEAVVNIIRSNTILEDIDLLGIKLAREEEMGLVDLVDKLPNILTSSYVIYWKKIINILPVNKILELFKKHDDNAYKFMCNVISEEHICNYIPMKRISSFKKMMLWAKMGKICCIISHIQTGNNSEIYLKHILHLLTEENLNTIMNKCDVSGFNAMYVLIYYPTLLYQHSNWIDYTIDAIEPELVDYIIYKDKLENYRKLLCISKEIVYNLPIINLSSEIQQIK